MSVHYVLYSICHGSGFAEVLHSCGACSCKLTTLLAGQQSCVRLHNKVPAEPEQQESR